MYHYLLQFCKVIHQKHGAQVILEIYSTNKYKCFESVEIYLTCLSWLFIRLQTLTMDLCLWPCVCIDRLIGQTALYCFNIEVTQVGDHVSVMMRWLVKSLFDKYLTPGLSNNKYLTPVLINNHRLILIGLQNFITTWPCCKSGTVSNMIHSYWGCVNVSTCHSLMNK